MIWDILDEPFSEQGSWEVTPYVPEEHFVDYVEWLPEGGVRFYATGFIMIAGIADREEPWVLPQPVLPAEVTIEFKTLISQSWLLMGFQVGGHSGLLHVNQPSSQVEMNNKAKPTVILPGTWYTFRMVFSGGTCSLYKKTDTSLWELAAYWSSLMVSSENMISAFQISLGFAAEVKLEYLKIASGVHAPSNEPEMEEDSIDLFAELEARRSGILALAGEFVVRHPGSGDLKAGLELRTVCISQGISIEAYIRSEAIKNCNGI